MYSSWSSRGVELPHGTKLQMTYNGREHTGEIRHGKWVVARQEYDSPSGAAKAVARTWRGRPPSINGWDYWQVKRPQDAEWRSLSQLRLM